MTQQATGQKKKGMFRGWWIPPAGLIHGFWGMGMFYYAWSIFVPHLMRDLRISATTISLASTIGRFEGGPEGPVVGWILEKWGPRVMAIIGFIIAAAGFAVIGLLPEGEWAAPLMLLGYGVLVLTGANCALYQSSFVSVAKWFIKHRGKVIGAITLGAGFGQAILIPMTQATVTSVGWRNTALIVAALTILINVPAAFGFPKGKPEDHGLYPDGMGEEEYKETQRAAAAGQVEVRTADISFTARQASRMWQFYTVGVGMGLIQLGVLAPSMFQNIAMQEAGYTATTAALFYSANAIATIVGRLLVTVTGDRFNPRWAITLYYTIAGLGFIFFTFANQGVGWVWAWVASGVGFGAFVATGTILTAWYFGRAALGTVQGWMRVVQFVASAWGPMMVGLLRDWTGSFAWSFRFGALGFFLGALLIAITPRPRPKVVAQEPASIKS